MTMVGLLKLKVNCCSKGSMVTYYYIQEVLGVLIILSLSQRLQFILVIIKGGISPFHGWMQPVVTSCRHYGMCWLLRVQKLPYYILLVQLINPVLSWIVVLGMLLPALQCLMVHNLVVRVFLLLTSSGNVLIIMLIFDVLSITYLVLYLLLLNTVLSSVSLGNNLFVSYEFMYLMGGFPGALPFYIKLYMAFITLTTGGVFGVLILVSILLNVLCTLSMVLEHNASARWGANKLYS